MATLAVSLYDRARLPPRDLTLDVTPSTQRSRIRLELAPPARFTACWHVTDETIVPRLLALGRQHLASTFPDLQQHGVDFISDALAHTQRRAPFLPLGSDRQFEHFRSELVDSFLARFFFCLTDDVGTFITEDALETVFGTRPDALWFRDGTCRVVLEQETTGDMVAHARSLPELGQGPRGGGRWLNFDPNLPRDGNTILAEMAVSLLTRGENGRRGGGPHRRLWGLILDGETFILCRTERIASGPHEANAIVTSSLGTVGSDETPFLAVMMATLLVGADELPMDQGLRQLVAAEYHRESSKRQVPAQGQQAGSGSGGSGTGGDL